MRFEGFSFGFIQIDGSTYEHDVVIDHGEVRKRKKKPSKKFRDAFGHTPISLEEKIPWLCRCLVIGTGTGRLPVMDEVKREAKRRGIKSGHPAHRQGHRSAEERTCRNQRYSACDLLTGAVKDQPCCQPINCDDGDQKVRLFPTSTRTF